MHGQHPCMDITLILSVIRRCSMPENSGNNELSPAAEVKIAAFKRCYQQEPLTAHFDIVLPLNL